MKQKDKYIKENNYMNAQISKTIKCNLSIALSCVLTLLTIIGLMSAMTQSSYAATGTYTDLIPVESDAGEALTAKQVEFNGIKWYIIADNSTSDTAGTVTLLAADKIADRQWGYASEFNQIDLEDEDLSRFKYKASPIKKYVDGMTSGSGLFAGVAGAIAPTDLTDEGVSGARLFLLSEEEANSLPNRVRACPGSDWWLRTYDYFSMEPYLKLVRTLTSNDGTVYGQVGSYKASYICGVRPALRLDLSKVAYLSGPKKFILKSQMINVTGLDIDSSDNSVCVNGSLNLKTTVYPDNATDKTVVWSSDDPSVATIDSDGKVTGVSIGSTTITATATNGTPVTTDDITKTCTVYVKEAVSISGSVTWDDNDDQDGARPDRITVNLLSNGVKLRSLTATADDGWSWTFNDVPKYNENGEEISFTISQDALQRYKTTYNGYNIINTRTPATQSLTVHVTWKDDKNSEGTRPRKIKINLLADGEPVLEGRTLTAPSQAETSSYRLGDDYPVYSHGKKIKYTVTEETVAGYSTLVQGMNITNAYDPSKMQISVQKLWDDNDNQDGIRPESVTVRLLADGSDTGKTLELSEAENWSGTFINISRDGDDGEIYYTIEEVGTDVITGTDGSGTYSSEVSGTAADGFTITNKHTPETTDIKVKKVWNDSDNQDGKRPSSITVNLRANGEVAKSQNLTGDNWEYTFENVPVYENGKKISYGVSEDDVVDEDGEKVYNSSVSGNAVEGFTITNTRDTEKVTLNVFKVWDDEDDIEGFRPDSVEVYLLKDGERISTSNPVIINGEIIENVDPLILSDRNGWTGSFVNLARYEDGDYVQYDVAEEETGVITGTDGAGTYEIEKDNRQSYSITITNKHTPQYIDIPVEISWIDNNDRYGLRPDAVGITLSADDVPQETKYAADEDGWTLSFDNLPLYRDANKKTYTISADVPDGYTSEVTGNTEDGYTIKYTFKNAYKVTWLNDDESELEIDERVGYGTMPSYDGAEPEKSSMPDHYEFTGWTPELSEVTADVTYTATYKEKPHELEKVNAADPTCTEDGHSIYWKCSICGKVFSDKNGVSEIDEEDTVIKKLGHDYRYAGMTWSYTNSYATATFICEHDSSHVETANAIVTAETVDSTCEKEGLTVYTATVSYGGRKYTETKTTGIDAKKHDWSDPKYTWSKDGSLCIAERTCSKCDITEIETAGGEPEVTKAATCTEKGETTYTTIFTNTAFEKQTKTLTDIEALGHSWDAGKVTKAATEKATGVKTYTCKLCKATKTESIPKLKPSTPKVSGMLMTTITAKENTAVNISWTKVTGADGYEIYFTRCNFGGRELTAKKIKTIKGNKTFKWTLSELKKGTAYKSYVKAYVMQNGKKVYVRTSPLVHGFTSNGTKNYTNAKSVTVNKTTISLKKGKTFKIKASVKKVKNGRKLMDKSHAATLRYMSSTKKIATVSGSGKITAKTKGTCYIYVYAHNGVYKKVKVTVK